MISHGNTFRADLLPILTFLRRKRIGHSVVGLWFSANPMVLFRPGQFLEISLPHLNPDSRGIRREFTIASAPSEHELMLAVKFDQPGSTFKQRLRHLEPGEQVETTYCGGNFVLPVEPQVPIVLIAGGIGITPYRSMLQWLTETHQQRDVVLIHAVARTEDFLFESELAAAEKAGTTIHRIVGHPPSNWLGEQGIVDAARIKRLVPDFIRREIYLCGPESLVSSLAAALPCLGVSPDRIHRDAFPGYPNNE